MTYIGRGVPDAGSLVVESRAPTMEKKTVPDATTTEEQERRGLHVLPIIVALVAVLAALAISEAAARFFFPAPQVYRLQVEKPESAFQHSPNPPLGHELKASFRGVSETCHDRFPFTNADGQRDLERKIERADGVYRIALLGDSVVAGHGECDFEKTLSQKLEKLLPGTEVLNFGVGGYCTLSEVELLRTKGLKYKPDLAALVFVANDYFNANSSAAQLVGFERPRWMNELFLASHLFRHAALRLNLMHFRDEFFPPVSYVTQEDNVEAGLALLSKLAAESRTDAAIFLWPYFTDRGIDAPTRAAYEVPPGPEVTDIAARWKLPVYDLAPAFRAHFAEIVARGKRKRRPSPRWVYTQGDGVHPSPLGAEVGAKAMEAIIRSKISDRG